MNDNIDELTSDDGEDSEYGDNSEDSDSSSSNSLGEYSNSKPYFIITGELNVCYEMNT